MQSRRSTHVSPLAIVLPHPSLPLPRRRSSLLSANAPSSPHTPRSCASPTIFFSPSNNRKSTDSWNSSIGPDDQEYEWKQDQVLLLTRTLDALPAHLVTPFNGPIPPSNLLDKIARGVSDAKGPFEWPHSIRATRVKLIELSRLRAKEEAMAEQQRRIIREEPEVEIEDSSNYSYYHDLSEKPVPIHPRRPLYRQSSMDFMNSVGTDIKDNENIARLSNRLQRTDRHFTPPPTFHPYSRSASRKSSSPSCPSDVPSLISPSTPSSSTLNSLSSLSSHPRVMRRTLSSLSSTSISMLSNSSNGNPLPDPRVQRVRRSDPFCAPGPVPPPKDIALSSIGFKRAPSFGALAQEIRREKAAGGLVEPRMQHVRQNSGSYPSSDEEEKIRTRQAKKPRTKTAGVLSPRETTPPVSSAPSSPLAPSTPGSPIKSPVSAPKEKTSGKSKSKIPRPDDTMKSPKSPISKVSKKSDPKPSVGEKEKVRKPVAMNLQRNPSMFGAELPHLRSPSNVVAQVPTPSPRHATKLRSPSPAVLAPAAPLSPGVPIPLSPTASLKVKTLRRVRRLAPGRRISFGSLLAPGEDADADGEGEGEESGAMSCLGSAFQMH